VGKLPTSQLLALLKCIKPTRGSVVPPRPGFDSGVHRVGRDRYLVVSTDPCTGVPHKWFGWLLVHYAASDVAMFGVEPRYLALNLLGPPGTSFESYRSVMRQSCVAAKELNATIVTGHTGSYDGLTRLVGTCTAYGFIDSKRLITPDGSKPEDLILCTKPLGLELLMNFALARRNLANGLFGRKRARQLSRMMKMQSSVKEALVLSRLQGIHAMHDATEGGLVAALNEMADTSSLGFTLDFEKLSIVAEANILAEHYSLTVPQLMAMSSTGTLLAAVSQRNWESAVRALSATGLRPVIIGEFTRFRQRSLRANGKVKDFPRSAEDPYAKIMNR
jgi:hydrogenase expression/formation protein HypE